MLSALDKTKATGTRKMNSHQVERALGNLVDIVHCLLQAARKR